MEVFDTRTHRGDGSRLSCPCAESRRRLRAPGRLFHDRQLKNKAQLPDALQDAHIKDKIDRILQSKGLRKVDSGPADLVVTYQATMMVQQEVDTYQDNPDMASGLGWDWGLGWGWGWGDDPDYSSSQVVSIRKGDLLVDMTDTRIEKIIFRGYSTEAFHIDSIKEDKLLSKALDKMFKNFPPNGKFKRT
jgi:hypothetical protein